MTGAARGIGKGIASSLLRAGWAVVLGDVDAVEGLQTAEELARLGSVEFVAMDVADETSVQAALEQIEGDFGRLDGLVNNAGLADPDNGPLEQLALESWNGGVINFVFGHNMLQQRMHVCRPRRSRGVKPHETYPLFPKN